MSFAVAFEQKFNTIDLNDGSESAMLTSSRGIGYAQDHIWFHNKNCESKITSKVMWIIYFQYWKQVIGFTFFIED